MRSAFLSAVIAERLCSAELVSGQPNRSLKQSPPRRTIRILVRGELWAPLLKLYVFRVSGVASPPLRYLA